MTPHFEASDGLIIPNTSHNKGDLTGHRIASMVAERYLGNSNFGEVPDHNEGVCDSEQTVKHENTISNLRSSVEH